MLGTLNGGLEARGVRLSSEQISAEVEGVNEVVDGLIVLTRVNVHYRLRIPPGSRETVERLLSKHQDKCPTARTLRGCVQVTWTADIEEESA
jgi:organic hydroperoxide reductase OsmC/OhrA